MFFLQDGGLKFQSSEEEGKLTEDEDYVESVSPQEDVEYLPPSNNTPEQKVVYTDYFLFFLDEFSCNFYIFIDKMLDTSNYAMHHLNCIFSLR